MDSQNSSGVCAPQPISLREDILQMNYLMTNTNTNRPRYAHTHHIHTNSNSINLRRRQKKQEQSSFSFLEGDQDGQTKREEKKCKKINQYFQNVKSRTSRNSNHISISSMSKTYSMLAMSQRKNKNISNSNNKDNPINKQQLRTSSHSKFKTKTPPPIPTIPIVPSFSAKQLQNQNQNSYRRIQKKHNHKTLRDLGLQNWLNQALIQASPTLGIDKRQENSGLKTYRIDRSQLLKIGINPQKINRLYGSFFVYSIGFNNLLQDVCNGNILLKNSIWRVFAVLLEYCAGGKFETMIGEIQRDKQLKIQEMKNQIQRRQQIIQKSQENNDKKNAKILKQVRELQKETKNLLEEREMILQQFHQTEQAFNQEISLRLKYQTRINQIHGVYQELSQKYSKLKEEHFKNLEILKETKNINAVLRKDLMNANNILKQKTQIIEDFGQNKQFLETRCAKLQADNKDNVTRCIQMKSEFVNFQNIIVQKSRIIQHYELTIANMQSTQKSMQLILKSKGEQFQRAMKENALLHEHMHKNVILIGQLTQQKRQIGYKTAAIASQRHIQLKKMQEKQQKLKTAIKEISFLSENVGEKQIDLEAQKDKNQSLQKDIESHVQNIKQMKAKYIETLNLLDAANAAIRYLEEAVNKRENNQEKYKIQIEKYKSKVEQSKVKIVQKQSRITILQSNLKTTDLIWQQKYNKLQLQLNWTKQKCQKFEKQKETLVKQTDDFKEKYEKIYIDFKNQKFERSNLDIYYKQSLSVMQQEIEHIKKLNIQISQLNQTVQQYKRKYNSLENIHKNKVQILQKDTKMWKQKFLQLEDKSRQKLMYIHAMQYEDLYARFASLEEKYTNTFEKHSKCQKIINNLQAEKFQFQQNSKSLSKSTNEPHIKIQYVKMEQQAKYLKQKLQYQIAKYAQNQESLAKAHREKGIVLQMLRKAQSQFMQKIKLKNSQLKQLNQKYRSSIQLSEQQLKENQKLTAKYEQESKENKQKIQQLSHKNNTDKSPNKNKDKKNIEKQKQQKQKPKKVIEQINNTDSQLSITKFNVVDSANDIQMVPSFYEKVEVQDDEESENGINEKNNEDLIKKREDIKKKIKGAFLYYAK